MPSVISGISARPQPWDRLPPKPESDSRRKAAVSGLVHCSCAALLEKWHVHHKPLPGVNSRHAVECGETDSPSRSIAALDRTETRNGPGTGGVLNGSRHSLGPSMIQPSSESALPAASDSTTLSGTNRAPFQRTLEDSGGGQRFRGGTTNNMSPW